MYSFKCPSIMPWVPCQATSILRIDSYPFVSWQRPDFDVDVGDGQFGRKACRLPSQEGHEHHAPGDHLLYGDSPLETCGGIVSQVFHFAVAFEDPVPVPEPPL